MKKLAVPEIEKGIEKIAQEYLYDIQSLGNHDRFTDRQKDWKFIDKRRSFQIINPTNVNSVVVWEETFLEGCTRDFLINPIFDFLFKSSGVDIDWKYGYTSGNYTITNREYELDSSIEFIIQVDEERIGCRYTPSSYSAREWQYMERDAKYITDGIKIPGFNRLSPIDEIYSIDWSSNIDPRHKDIEDQREYVIKELSVEEFFVRYFDIEIYKLFLEITKKAVTEARMIIALQAKPQLLRNNLLQFKDTVMEFVTSDSFPKLNYVFDKKRIAPINGKLTSLDQQCIDESFFQEGKYESLIGDSEFAQSLITAEYLYQSIAEGLSIDYSSVVLGYIKSIEQLLYLYYSCAFQGKKELDYWDKYRNNKKGNDFDLALPEFRLDPYDSQYRQEKYSHQIKTGKFAPTIGTLMYFLRYHDPVWGVSEDGKEYIFSCLDDYREYCRNSHLHKDNIKADDYEKINRIRNNTYVVLYLVLGGFKLLNDPDNQNQLGIFDYSFDRLLKKIQSNRNRIYEIEIENGYRGMAFFDHGDNPTYKETGAIVDAKLTFVKFEIEWAEEKTREEFEAGILTPAFYEKNVIVFNRELHPNRIVSRCIRFK